MLLLGLPALSVGTLVYWCFPVANSRDCENTAESYTGCLWWDGSHCCLPAREGSITGLVGRSVCRLHDLSVVSIWVVRFPPRQPKDMQLGTGEPVRKITDLKMCRLT